MSGRIKYDRSKLEDIYRMGKFKEKEFDGGKVVQNPFDGSGFLHCDIQKAKNKYGDVKWTAHIAHTDHIYPLEDIYNYRQSSPFLKNNLSLEECKNIANSDFNFQLISGHDNMSKGSKTNIELAVTDLKEGNIYKAANEVRTGVQGELSVKSSMYKKASENAAQRYSNKAMPLLAEVGGTFTDGAVKGLEAAAPILLANAIKDMCLIANGDKTLREGLKDNTVLIAETAAIGGGREVVISSVSKVAPEVAAVIDSPEFMEIAVVSIMVANSTVKYINGEINGGQLVEEVIQTGAVWMASKIGRVYGAKIGALIGTAIAPGVGTAAGAVVGEVIGCIVATVACEIVTNVIFDTIHHLNDYKKQEARLKQFERVALLEMKQRRDEFENLVKEYYGHWDTTIEKSFNDVIYYTSINTFDFLKITKGIDDILKLFGLHVRYNSLEEYERDMDKPLILTLE